MFLGFFLVYNSGANHKTKIGRDCVVEVVVGVTKVDTDTIGSVRVEHVGVAPESPIPTGVCRDGSWKMRKLVAWGCQRCVSMWREVG